GGGRPVRGGRADHQHGGLHREDRGRAVALQLTQGRPADPWTGARSSRTVPCGWLGDNVTVPPSDSARSRRLRRPLCRSWLEIPTPSSVTRAVSSLAPT